MKHHFSAIFLLKQKYAEILNQKNRCRIEAHQSLLPVLYVNIKVVHNLRFPAKPCRFVTGRKPR